MQSIPSDREWIERCRIVAAQELARRGWTLADHPALFAPGETFLDRVIARVESWEKEHKRSQRLIRDATVHEYCHLLCTAVKRDGSRVQAIALDEAKRYAWPTALKYGEDRAQAEATILRALTQAWLNIERCEPGSFLAWFTQIVINEARNLGRKERRVAGHEISVSDLQPSDKATAEDDFDALDRLMAITQTDPYDDVLRALSRPLLIEKLRRCLNNARREFIIIAQFFLELNPSEIAHHLAVKVNTVHVEKSRALKYIRECCAEFIAELQQLVGARQLRGGQES